MQKNCINKTDIMVVNVLRKISQKMQHVKTI